MSDKIKQVAQAIRSGMEASGVVSLVANGPKGEAALQQFFEVLAMDAIEAMREPTEEMKSAGFDASPHDVGGCRDQISQDEEWMQLVVLDPYRAMIDEALK